MKEEDYNDEDSSDDHMNSNLNKTRKYDRANVEDSMSNEESPRVSEEDEPNKVPKPKDSKGASFY